jgi:hypothetical protein
LVYNSSIRKNNTKHKPTSSTFSVMMIQIILYFQRIQTRINWSRLVKRNTGSGVSRNHSSRQHPIKE